MSRIHANNYITTLNGAITNSATSLVVTSNTGFPSIGAGVVANLTLQNGSAIEIVKATAISGSTVTIVRAQEGTTAQAFANGSTVSIRPTADSFDRKADSDSPTFTGTVVLPSTTSIGSTTSTELSYVHGVTSAIQTQLNALGGVVSSGTINQLAYYAATGSSVSGLATAANGILATDGSSVPSITSTLPSAVQLNITALGTMSQVINMNTHQINGVVDPTSSQDAATKNYVDTVVTGLNPQVAVNYASTTAFTVTYSNGSSGVGATLTNADTQAVFSIDGSSPAVGKRILIKDQSSQLQNGVYTVTNVGSVSTNWVLTRAADFNTPTTITDSGMIPVISGTTNAGTGWLETANITAVGTDSIIFVQFGQTAGTIPVTGGGTGLTGANQGDLLYGSASNTLSTLAKDTNSTRYLSNTGTSNNPAWAQINLSNGVTNTLGTSNGGTGVTSVTISPTASSFAGWDSHSNLSSNSFLSGYTTTATAAATTTLTVSSTQQQYFTGTTTQTVVLPVTSTLALGQSFIVVNNSTGAVTVQSSGANTISTLTAGTVGTFTCILTSGTTAASWNATASYSSNGNVIGAASSTDKAIAIFNGTGGLTIQNSTITIPSSNTISLISALKDTNGNQFLGATATGTAVNYINLTNSAAGSDPSIQPAGSDSNRALALQGKGTKGVLISGTTKKLTVDAIDIWVGSQAVASNTAVGTQALQGTNNASATDNTAMGNLAGTAITTGAQNTCIGSLAGTAISGTTGANNTAIGYNAIAGVVGGGKNTAIGSGAGVSGATGGATLNGSGTDNTLIGYRATCDTNSSVGCIAIGEDAVAAKSTGSTSGTNGPGIAIGSAAALVGFRGDGSIFPGNLWRVKVNGTHYMIPLAADGSTALPVANGGTNVTSVTTSPTASSFAGWDANSNLSTNNILTGYATTATSAGTKTLTVTSKRAQVYTGTTTHTQVMPDVSTLAQGTLYITTNLSTGVVTVQSSGTNTIQAMAANTTLILQSNATSGTSASVWDVVEYVPAASDITGSGSLVRATSPTLVTPTLGAASATSINFGQTNSLSYYDSASFTPGIKFGGGNTGITYTTQTGYYTRVGNLVTFTLFILLSSKGSSTGAATITGLPFATHNSASLYNLFSLYIENVTFTGNPICYASSNSSTINLVTLVSGAGSSALADTNFTNTSDLIISGSYSI